MRKKFTKLISDAVRNFSITNQFCKGDKFAVKLPYY